VYLILQAQLLLLSHTYKVKRQRRPRLSGAADLVDKNPERPEAGENSCRAANGVRGWWRCTRLLPIANHTGGIFPICGAAL